MFPDIKIVESQHHEELTAILNGRFFPATNRTMNVPANALRDVSSDWQEFLPRERFWVRPRSKDGSSDRVFILRVLHQEGSQTFGVEVASDDGTWADETMRVIVQNGITATIFRNHYLQVSFGVRIRPESGDADHDGLHVEFRKEDPVTRDDIIMDPDVE